MAKKSESADDAVVRYEKPKILLADLPIEVSDRLRVAGYNVLPGAFGRPYKVPKGDGYLPVIPKPSLPNYAEREIVVVDLAASETAEGPSGDKVASLEELDWYAKTSRGEIDPRPRVMTSLRDFSDRILDAGGIFVVFADARRSQELVFARGDRFSKGLRIEQELREDNWSLLTTFSHDHLAVVADHGSEIVASQGSDSLSVFIQKYLRDAVFTATLQPNYPMREKGKGLLFIPLAWNKYQAAVSCLLVPRGVEDKGLVLVLPQFADKEGTILDLIQNVLPELRPNLFPEHEGGRWVQREEYEHSGILAKKSAQLEAQRRAAEAIARLEQEIESERSQLAFLHAILTGTDKVLVDAVKATLEFIGFEQVIDVDEADKEQQNKQEDLQVLDNSPRLLFEVKGLSGFPREGNTLQVTKFVLRRIKGWNRTDVTGISLINHQRNLPALERNHVTAFTTQQVDDAKENGTGLMTTWTLFRLVRGMIRWGWPGKTIRDCFYGKGLLPQIPSHYVEVGTVAHYWDNISVISVEISNAELCVGDRVGYLFAEGFFEEVVTSLRLDKAAIQKATPGQRVGIKTTCKRNQLPDGTIVFRVG